MSAIAASLALLLGCFVPQSWPLSRPPWHKYGRRAGVACTLILLVSLAKHSASSNLCCPCANSSGSEVWLTMKLVAGGGCAAVVGCLSPGFSCQTKTCARSIMIWWMTMPALVLEPLSVHISLSASSISFRMAWLLAMNRFALA